MSRLHAAVNVVAADLCVTCWHTLWEHLMPCQVEGCTGTCSKFTLERDAMDVLDHRTPVKPMNPDWGPNLEPEPEWDETPIYNRLKLEHVARVVKEYYSELRVKRERREQNKQGIANLITWTST